jgi:hypothetical protein
MVGTSQEKRDGPWRRRDREFAARPAIPAEVALTGGLPMPLSSTLVVTSEALMSQVSASWLVITV